MVFAPSDGRADSMLAAFKIVVAGGFGAGKTTLVGAVSEVQPLRTEESLSRAGLGLDDRAGVEDKTTTTVAMDFGRITINEHLILYLFGTPGQERFWFMWDELSYGAIGAVILADTRRLSDCFPSVDYFEKGGLPFVIALNCFGDSPQYDPEDVRAALDLGPHVPVMYCDARKSSSVKQVLITLVETVLATSPPPPRTQPVVPPAPPAQHASKATDFFSAPPPTGPAAPPPAQAQTQTPAPHPHSAAERWPAAVGHHKH
jgi:signal recognition particle receptor subunit beta